MKVIYSALPVGRTLFLNSFSQAIENKVVPQTIKSFPERAG
jgi:hypothetical protein